MANLPFQLWHWEIISEARLEEVSLFASKTVTETVEEAATVAEIFEFDENFEIRVEKCKSLLEDFDFSYRVFCVCHAE